jgi:hypothetical protein
MNSMGLCNFLEENPAKLIVRQLILVLLAAVRNRDLLAPLDIYAF